MKLPSSSTEYQTLVAGCVKATPSSDSSSSPRRTVAGTAPPSDTILVQHVVHLLPAQNFFALSSLVCSRLPGKGSSAWEDPPATGIAFPFSGSPPTTEVLWFRNSAADCSGTACRRSLSTCPRFYVVRPVGASTSRSPFLQEAVCTTRCSSKRLRSVAAADRCRGPC